MLYLTSLFNIGLIKARWFYLLDWSSSELWFINLFLICFSYVDRVDNLISHIGYNYIARSLSYAAAVLELAKNSCMNSRNIILNKESLKIIIVEVFKD